ncbi:MAG: hypothetical protein U9R19_08975 [Bacteroidota bacterium]|nr:hypothetical protein [Bacteroidota bacterium]
MDFNKDKILEMDDSGLARALILRNEYVDDAKKVIIDESIKRGIIQSESDLQQARFAPINLKKQRFFQFSAITSIEDAHQVSNSIVRYFYFISLGYGGIAAIYKIFASSFYLWVNLFLMIVALILALLFHRFKSHFISQVYVFFAAISILHTLFALIINAEMVAVLGLFINFILFYFASEAYFATRYIKTNT